MNNTDRIGAQEAARSVAVIPGDGVGKEVIPVALQILGEVCRREDCVIQTESFPWGSEYYEQSGRMMAADALETLAGYDAIFFGAVGWPTVPDHITLWGLRLAIVQGFDQCVNVRPVTLLPGTRSPLENRGAGEIDFVVVRENSEGEYSGIGGRAHSGLPSELATQTAVYTRRAIERVARYALDLAATRPAKRLTSVTKSNASQYASVLWDEVVAEVAGSDERISFDSVLVDAATARLVLQPESVDVLVASNLHADILSDLTASLAGSLGVAPSGNYHLDGRYPSMFEPVHGSAPDIAGQDRANPIAAVLCAAMLLEHLGHERPAVRIRAAVDDVCAQGILTPDLGGQNGTRDVADALLSSVRSAGSHGVEAAGVAPQ
jgi:tartrate dehydrogenase/decarboxylase/D-malate dehydrogenase